MNFFGHCYTSLSTPLTGIFYITAPAQLYAIIRDRRVLSVVALINRAQILRPSSLLRNATFGSTGTMIDAKVFIAKLNGANYFVRATQTEVLLEAKDIWKYVGNKLSSNTSNSPSVPVKISAIITY